MAYDYSKLKGRIIEKFDTYRAFAAALGIAPQYISPKLKGKIDITKAEIINWSELLDIDPSEYGSYFFCLKGQESKEVEN